MEEGGKRRGRGKREGCGVGEEGRMSWVSGTLGDWRGIRLELCRGIIQVFLFYQISQLDTTFHDLQSRVSSPSRVCRMGSVDFVAVERGGIVCALHLGDSFGSERKRRFKKF